MAERKRIGVPISGIDTSTPDHSVIDGKCEVLHNLRYTGGAWRNMHPFIASEQLPDLEGNVIAYHHPADVDNAYITYYYDDIKKTYTFFRSVVATYSNEWSWRHTKLLSFDSHSRNIEEVVQIGHFGKMLILGHNPSKTFHFFYLATSDTGNPYYTKSDIDSTSLNLSLAIPGDSPGNSKIAFLSNFNDGVARCVVGNADGTFGFDDKLRETDFNGQYKYFRGEFLMVATLVSEEGEIIKVSPMRLFNSALEFEDKFPSQNRQYAYKYHDNVNAFIATKGYESQTLSDRCIKYPGSFFFCEAEATISLDNISEGARAAYVDIYTTRLYNLLEYETRTKWGDNTIDLFKEPLYRAKRINISDFKETNQLTFSIDSTFFNNVESGILFSPTQTSADLYGRIALEYNNRLHLTDVYTKLNYDSLYDYLERVAANDIGFNKFLARVSYDGEKAWSQTQLDRLSLSSRYFVCSGNVIDMYASNNKNTAHKKYTMRYSALYNISYALAYSDIINDDEKHYDVAYGLDIRTSTTSLAPQKYKSLSEYGDVDSVPTIPTSLSEIRTQNAIRVSATNIPYSFPYENSYRVGARESKIISMNSAAIEMSDSKFGEYPLYVFTNEGVWAIQSGQETLYSAIIPINYDVAINPNTLAVNGAILYFTDKGLSALSGEGTKDISAPIHTKENRIPQWMLNTKMVYLPEWNEVVCVNDNNGMAYVFSLNNGVWSTRNIAEGYVINNSELIAEDGKIYNLRDEHESFGTSTTFALHLPTASTFSLMRNAEETKYKWISEWGVLKQSGDEDVEVRLYEYDEVDEIERYRRRYVYRPKHPAYSLTQYNFKAEVLAKLDKHLNPRELIFLVADEGFAYNGEPPFGIGTYPEEPRFTTVNVYSPNGELITTLRKKDNPDNNIYIDTRYFYDTNIPAIGINPEMYGMAFAPDTIDNYSGKIRIYPYGYFHSYYPDGYIHPDNLVAPDDDVWNDVIGWFNTFYADDDRIYVWRTLYFHEDDSLLYYAFNNPLTLDDAEDPRVVCVYDNGNSTIAYLCTQDTQDKEDYPFDDHVSVVIDEDSGDLGGSDNNTGGDNGDSGGSDSGDNGDNGSNEGGEGGDNGGDIGGGDDNTGDVPIYNPTHIRLKTRPIKLGTMELKRAETIIVRFESSTMQSIKVIVKGSIDTNTWHTLREITTKTNKDIVIRRTPFSVKYLQFSIEGECNTDIRILAFELEYYERMRHRMR